MKLLSPRLASSPSSVERFKQEGRLASQMSHPRCVFVLSADTDNGRPYIVMELMPGRTLSTVCVVGEVVYAAELSGQFHCLDAHTGKHFWEYDTKASIWTAPYYVDGRVLLGTENGDLFVFRHDPRPEVIDELDNPTAVN